MTTRDSGLYHWLSLPSVYTGFQNLLGGTSARQETEHQYIRVQPGDRVLDIGCGPADYLAYFPDDVDYVGFDMNPAYIDAAQQNFGNRGKFYCKRLETETMEGEAPFDIVLASGLLHHLDDQQALHLFHIAASAMKPDGKLITIDGCYTSPQSPLARLIISMDRGTFVRTVNEYKALAQTIFSSVNCHIRHDMLKIPYTHLVMECRLAPCALEGALL
jgi:SAM-dependent methyltransferase